MSATNLITALRTETREDSITPSRIADILDAVLKEGGSGGSVPADLAERLDAVGITAANAKNTADAAKTAADSAKTAADTAKTPPTQPKTPPTHSRIPSPDYRQRSDQSRRSGPAPPPNSTL